MMVLEKRLCPSAKISYTVSCNISLYHECNGGGITIHPKNMYRCISNTVITRANTSSKGYIAVINNSLR